MSQDKKSEKEVAKAEGTEQGQTEELNEEQLESVAGGVLIGLNVGTIGHKDLVAGLSGELAHKDLVASPVVNTAFKFKK